MHSQFIHAGICCLYSNRGGGDFLHPHAVELLQQWLTHFLKPNQYEIGECSLAPIITFNFFEQHGGGGVPTYKILIDQSSTRVYNGQLSKSAQQSREKGRTGGRWREIITFNYSIFGDLWLICQGYFFSCSKPCRTMLR